MARSHTRYDKYRVAFSLTRYLVVSLSGGRKVSRVMDRRMSLHGGIIPEKLHVVTPTVEGTYLTVTCGNVRDCMDTKDVMCLCQTTSWHVAVVRML